MAQDEIPVQLQTCETVMKHLNPIIMEDCQIKGNWDAMESISTCITWIEGNCDDTESILKCITWHGQGKFRCRSKNHDLQTEHLSLAPVHIYVNSQKQPWTPQKPQWNQPHCCVPVGEYPCSTATNINSFRLKFVGGFRQKLIFSCEKKKSQHVFLIL